MPISFSGLAIVTAVAFPGELMMEIEAHDREGQGGTEQPGRRVGRGRGSFVGQRGSS